MDASQHIVHPKGAGCWGWGFLSCPSGRLIMLAASLHPALFPVVFSKSYFLQGAQFWAPCLLLRGAILSGAGLVVYPCIVRRCHRSCTHPTCNVTGMCPSSQCWPHVCWVLTHIGRCRTLCHVRVCCQQQGTVFFAALALGKLHGY